MLFSEMERTDAGPKPYAEPRYSYLNRSAREDCGRVRACLEDWFARYPDDHRPAFLAAFQSRRDSQFLAAVFELYLHELLRRLGYGVEVHPENPTGLPTRPDFLATEADGAKLYFEAALCLEESDEERGAEARKNIVYDALNQLGPTDFFLGMDTSGVPDTPPAGKKLSARVREWLAGLDADAVTAAANAGGTSAFPTMEYEHDGWRIEFVAIPKSRAMRGRPDVRPIGWQGGETKMLNTWERIRDKIVKKSGKYGKLDTPLVVAVNVVAIHLDRIDTMQALFGQEQWVIRLGSTNAEPTERRPNGAWFGPEGPRNTRVGAVLIADEVLPWSVATSEVCLIHNPWADPSVAGPICTLAQGVPDGDTMKWVDGVHPRGILGLPEGWPGLVF